jgi:alpha-amylase/alpha-mannosidase (GH57 family)
MADVALAFIWHQHQPYYPDNLANHNAMPWVRLHGVKDYYGMALHLLEYPEMRCTINLVPSLLVQLHAYTEEQATDQFMTASRIPADGLSEPDCLYLLDHFFMANVEHMIRPFARYAELHHRRGGGAHVDKSLLRRFHERDYRDLQVWFNMAWIHPLAFERNAELHELRSKGRNFTEEEKNWVLDQHVEILRQVVPMHLELEARGQVELTTTPFYHPILPLLFDKKLARESVPDAKLPRFTEGYPEDAEAQVRQAVEQHQRIFGKPPRGMWPAEGSVCQCMIPLLARHGISWIATDEGILSRSTHGLVSRDGRGHIRNPDRMYRPYRVVEEPHELAIVFRDRALSDLIGFHYQRNKPMAAAEDFISRLLAIGQAVSVSGPALVSVILDGENCWEHYPGGGVTFLRSLYELCTTTRGVQPVTVSHFLENHPPRDTLPRLFAGSWINHNFAIWIGHEEDNAAWDAVHRAREHLRQRGSQFGIQGPRPEGSANGPINRRNEEIAERIWRAWQEIYMAEGSDWFWWYGDDHSSAQDALFDYLFRKHLQNVYLLLGDTPPPELARPISRRIGRPIHSLPRALLDVRIDGRHSFFEWFSAGRYSCQNERGTMAMATSGPLRDVHFGFNLATLFIRVDFNGPARQALAEYSSLRIGFADPPGWDIQIFSPGQPEQSARLFHDGAALSTSRIEFAIEQILEVAVPFEDLGLAAEQAVQFFVEVLEGIQSHDRAPREGTISLQVPAADFELQMWDV